MEELDWKEQWKHHAPDYDHNQQLAIIDLSAWTSAFEDRFVKLKAGPGFGDLSHPTTRLMLRWMSESVKECHVVDIGCGSGVLGLCALGMGASFVYAVDIDPEALVHTKENAKLNNIRKKCKVCFSKDTPPLPLGVKWTFLINMIRTEQQAAWHSLPSLHSLSADIIASGILVEDRNTYLALVKTWGWHFVAEKQEGEWLGFHFRSIR
jgi:ribosomal protein L11 methyltransferase